MKRFNKLLSKTKKEISEISEISEIGHNIAVVLKSNDTEKVKKSLENLGIKSEKNDEQDTISQKPTEIILNDVISDSSKNDQEISIISNKEEEVDTHLEEDLINIAKMENHQEKVTETLKPTLTETNSVNGSVITLKPNYDEQLVIKQIKSFIKNICKNEFVKEIAPSLDNKSDLSLVTEKPLHLWGG